MTLRTTLRTTTLAAAALGGGTLLALAAPLAASAHVSVTPSGTAAGSYSVMTFAVGHGCEGSPTTSLTIEIPEGVDAVKPTVSATWDVETVTEPVGGEDAERVAQVVYTAVEPLPDAYRDTVSMQVLIPEDAAGTDLVFPVVQECTEGENLWTEVTEAGGEEPENAAPFFTVTESTGDAHSHGTAESDEDEHADDDHAEASEASDAAESDVLARVLGIGGLVVGAVGIVLAVTARRGAAKR
ncbi:YcnI family copper-binding membrane protein [Agromyces sp. SYSU T00194]|uniref:YcnI family copper-binding membrane protein n=1 Tax=Agromyces chitinivorans TaxID=3158560 RepID=UPI00339A3013